VLVVVRAYIEPSTSMSPGRKPALSQKTLAFLHAEVIHPFHAQRTCSFVERAARYLIWGALIGFVLLIISAPILLVLLIFMSINVTVVWLQIGAGLLMVCFLGFLLQIAQQSLGKAIGLALVGSLFSVSLYLYSYTSLPARLIHLPALIAYGVLYAWKGGECLQDYQHQRRPLLAFSLSSVLAIICFVLAGWYILQEAFVSYSSREDLLPLGLLASLYAVFISKESGTTNQKAGKFKSTIALRDHTDDKTTRDTTQPGVAADRFAREIIGF
jgi:hypothetical protein